MQDTDRTEKLIEVIKDHCSILFDSTHVDYVRTKKKDDIFEQIAQNLGYESGAAVKTEWNHLRNRHREALRRQKKKKSSDATCKIKPWQYQQQMAFLIPYMKNQMIGNNITPELDEYETGYDSKNLQPFNFHLKEELQEEYANILGSEEYVDDQHEIMHEGVIPSPSKEPKQLVKCEFGGQIPKKRQREENRNEVTDIAKRNTEEPSHDALYYFFMNIYHETKRMPTHVQCRVKRKFFNIINEEEENLLAPASSSADFSEVPLSISTVQNSNFSSLSPCSDS